MVSVDRTNDVDAKPLARTLGARIREARKAAGFTTRALAESCDLSQPFVSQLENGHAMPSVVTLIRLSDVLGTTLQALLEGEPHSQVSFVGAESGTQYSVAEGGDAMARVLVEGSNEFEALEFTARPGGLGPALAHAGKDFVYVVDGELRIELEGRDADVLHAGDTLSYPATIPHQWSVGEAGVRFVCVVISGASSSPNGHGLPDSDT